MCNEVRVEYRPYDAEQGERVDLRVEDRIEILRVEEFIKIGNDSILSE